ncbi:hypothetical protein HPB48_004618 [Haemaphysalis longicornis]|uniref:Reverse transcriptase domain-containing protein n=1 Tax=Haemaphysalis longicornis TaxID=44386 RepID=A0A9J6H1Y4_HAELO|nr:hypothetical protein HPB48_004618 [Haemaphysalis longicornis]
MLTALQSFLPTPTTPLCFFISLNATQLQTKANNVLETLNEWSMLNSLTINSTKTKAVIFRAKNQNYNMDGDLLIGASKIKIVASVKSLGIIFEEHINWTKHSDLVTSRVARVCRNSCQVAIRLAHHH